MSTNLFLIHLQELKYRFYYIIYSFLLSITYCAYNWESLFYFFIKILNVFPVIQKYLILNNFIYTGIMDIFINILFFCLVLCFLSNITLILFHIISFLITGLYTYELKLYLILSFISLSLLYITIFFTYTKMLPNIYIFFLQINELHNNNLFNFNFEIHISDLINLIYKITLFSCIISQLPIMLYIGYYLNLCNSTILQNYKNIFIFLIFLFMNLLIPLDILNAILIYLLILILYEISLFTITFLEINKIYTYEQSEI